MFNKKVALVICSYSGNKCGNHVLHPHKPRKSYFVDHRSRPSCYECALMDDPFGVTN